MDLLEKLDPKLLEQLESVTVLKTGDRVVFAFDAVLTHENALEIKAQIKDALGDDLRFLILGRAVDTYVIRAES